jgi:hypothetical protein
LTQLRKKGEGFGISQKVIGEPIAAFSKEIYSIKMLEKLYWKYDYNLACE